MIFFNKKKGKCGFLMIFLLPVIAMAQYQYDFEIDTVVPFKQVPEGRWRCTSQGAITGKYSLHHSYDNPEGGTDFLILGHDPVQAEDSLSLSFRIRHGYPPSSSNNWQVALLAEFHKESPGGMRSGIILGTNFSGSDGAVRFG